jgi:hypothetical protein
MIAKADIRRVQEWMGHADIQTTMRYLHFAPRAEDARLVAEAFAVSPPTDDGGRSRYPCASTRHRARMLGRRLRVRAREPSMFHRPPRFVPRRSPRALTHGEHGCSRPLSARDRAIRAHDDCRPFTAGLVGRHDGFVGALPTRTILASLKQATG